MDALEGLASSIAELGKTEPARAVRLYESYLAGCYEKANKLDDSSGSFGMFVDDLYAGWIKARQIAGADPDETAAWLLARMDDDQALPILELPLPSPPPEGAEWIEAYRQWRGDG